MVNRTAIDNERIAEEFVSPNKCDKVVCFVHVQIGTEISRQANATCSSIDW